MRYVIGTIRRVISILIVTLVPLTLHAAPPSRPSSSVRIVVRRNINLVPFQKVPQLSVLIEYLNAVHDLYWPKSKNTVTDTDAIVALASSDLVLRDAYANSMCDKWVDDATACVVTDNASLIAVSCIAMGQDLEAIFGNFLNKAPNVSSDPKVFTNAHVLAALAVDEYLYKQEIGKKIQMQDRSSCAQLMKEEVLEVAKSMEGMKTLTGFSEPVGKQGGGKSCSVVGSTWGETKLTGSESTGEGIGPVPSGMGPGGDQTGKGGPCPVNFGAMGGGKSIDDAGDYQAGGKTPSDMEPAGSGDGDDSGSDETEKKEKQTDGNDNQTVRDDSSTRSPGGDNGGNELTINPSTKSGEWGKFIGGKELEGYYAGYKVHEEGGTTTWVGGFGHYSGSGKGGGGVSIGINFRPADESAGGGRVCGNGLATIFTSCSGGGTNNGSCDDPNGPYSGTEMPDPDNPRNCDGGNGPAILVKNPQWWTDPTPDGNGNEEAPKGDPCQANPYTSSPKDKAACCKENPESPGCGSPSPVSSSFQSKPADLLKRWRLMRP